MKANLVREQKYKGKFEDPFQPYGEFKLCLYNKTAKRAYTVKYKDEALVNKAPTIYLEQKKGEAGGSAEVEVAEGIGVTC